MVTSDYLKRRMRELARFYEEKYTSTIHHLLSENQKLEDALADAEAELHRVATAAKVYAGQLGHKFTDTPQITLSRSRFFDRKNSRYVGIS